MKFAAGLIAAGLVAPGARALFFKKDDAVTAQVKGVPVDCLRTDRMSRG